MTLVYIDGLEDNGGLASTTGTVAFAIPGRTANCMRISGGSGIAQFRLPAPHSDTITVGFAFRPSSITGTNFNPAPLTLSGDAGGTPHVAMNLVGGNMSFVRGVSSTPVLAFTSVPPFPVINRWYYVEVQCRMHDTLGTIIARVDGVEVVNISALDTRNAGIGTTLDTVQFGMGITGTTLYDDVYVQAGSGDPFLGDCIVTTLLPNGNGSQSDFVGSDGNSTDNYQLVDELPPSGTDYVSSATVGDQDLYTLADLGVSPATILAVAPTLYAAKDEVGPRQVKPLLRGATTTTAGTALGLDFAYAQKQQVFTVNPETGAAWTLAEVNALQIGVEVA